jgi:hypothetical protein
MKARLKEPARDKVPPEIQIGDPVSPVYDLDPAQGIQRKFDAMTSHGKEDRSVPPRPGTRCRTGDKPVSGLTAQAG